MARFRLDSGAILDAIDQGAREGLDMATAFVANEAKSLAPQGETSHLKQSIGPGTSTGSYLQNTLRSSVTAGAPYASYVEFGTGERGESPPASGQKYAIRPKNRKALRFAAPGGGGFVFVSGTIWHPGMRAKPYMRPAIANNVGRIEDLVAAAIENALDRLE